jgi:hypothetical protein
MPAPKKVCPECGEELYAFHMPGHRLKEHGIEPAAKHAAKEQKTPDPEPAAPGRHAAPDVPRETLPGATEETAPRKPKLMDRIRSRRGRGRGGSAAPVPGDRPPRHAKPRGKRVALDSDISDIWAFGGRRLENTPHFATGRMLEYQAPAAGLIVDRAVAGTLPDRILFQPLARNRDKYEDVAFLLAGPLLTFSITTTGQQMEAALEAGDHEKFADLSNKMEMQKEMFVWVAKAMLPRLAEGVEKARDKKAKEDAAIAKAFPDLAGGTDPVEEFASMLFTPPNFEEVPQNGNRREPSHAAPTSGGEGPVSL